MQLRAARRSGGPQAAACFAGLVLGAMMLTHGACPADAQYRLGPEDVISITVLYHPELSVETATVRPDGKINYPLTGDLQVAGKTLPEVAQLLRNAVAKEIRNPHVSVRLVQRYMAPVYVLGAVRTPGAVAVRDPVTVAEAIALAGGLSESAAPRYGLILRSTGEQAQIEIVAELSGPAPVAQMRLQPGDTLVVSAQFLVSVVGEVHNSGRYPVEEGDRVADAIAAANGVTEVADAKQAKLLRADGRTIAVDLHAVVNEGRTQDNILLEPGDLILVPALQQRVTVVGAVNLPGRYDFDEGDRVSDALARAGGAAEDARRWAAAVVRRDGTTYGVDLEAVVQDAEQEQNLLLADGDTLLVPRKLEKVAVVGMVTKPGLIPLEPEMGVIEAIAAAGGWLTDEARPEATLLWRETDGEPSLTRVNARGLMLGRTDVDNPQLQPGDVIFVPSKKALTLDDVSRMLLGITGVLRVID